jgi:hypothetical protein
MGANLGPLRTPRFPKVILSTSAASATSSPTPQMTEACGYSEWDFGLTGIFTGYSVTIYGTLDPAAVNQDGSPNVNYPAPGAAGGAWFGLQAPLPESSDDAFQYFNPLTAITENLHYKGALVAVCAVATGTSQTGTVNVVAWATD